MFEKIMDGWNPNTKHLNIKVQKDEKDWLLWEVIIQCFQFVSKKTTNDSNDF